ncbi:MAG: phosphate propanoyltransferase [Patescibacteria group bacterium]|jgi:putative phosphotransacetylase
MANIKIPIEISARHIHLGNNDLEKLFGKGYALQPLKKISQPGQYAAKEALKVVGPKNLFKEVRIVGPNREKTQFELSVTDCYYLGIKPMLALSGENGGVNDSVTLVGPAGSVELKTGVIVAKRHLHITPSLAKDWGLKHLQEVAVRIEGERKLVFNKVIVRSRAGVDDLALHLDTDEANAAGIKPGDQGILLKK